MKQFFVITVCCCLLMLFGCGSEKSDPADSKAGEESTAPPGDHPYKRAIDRAKDVDKISQERNKRLSEEAEK